MPSNAQHLGRFAAEIHERALFLASQHRKTEYQLIRILQIIDQQKIFRDLGYSSLFQYAVGALRFSESNAYIFITVSRKANSLQSLQDALKSQMLSVSKANRIVSTLDAQNADHLISFAATHTNREIDNELVKIRPKALYPDRIHILTPKLRKVEMTVSEEFLEKFARAQQIVLRTRRHAMQNDKAFEFETVFTTILDDFLERHDPLRKAKRALDKKRPSLSRSAVAKASAQSAIPTHSKQSVTTRDEDQCTYVNPSGQRCSNRTWLHVHHVIPRSKGGGHQPDNLRTLCTLHHKMAHEKDRSTGPRELSKTGPRFNGKSADTS